ELKQKFFPMVIFSKFKKRGVLGLYNYLKRANFGLRMEIVTGDVEAEDRQPIFDAFNRGEIAILFICKIGRRGLDLLGCKSIWLIEGFDSGGEKRQTISRALRWGKIESQSAPPVEVFELISIFPIKSITKKDIEELTNLI